MYVYVHVSTHWRAGESAARTVKAALSQFEACFDTSAPATIVVTRFLENEQKAFELVEQAAATDALLVYTLVDPKVLSAVQTACKLFQVRNVDLWSNLLVRGRDSGCCTSCQHHVNICSTSCQHHVNIMSISCHHRFMCEGGHGGCAFLPETWSCSDREDLSLHN